jgi:enterochelin esterase-like enzyme
MGTVLALRLSLLTLLVAGVLAAGGFWAFHRPAPVPLTAAIADIEAGRRQTPLVGPAAADGSATVTFLAQRADGRPPRIVSDVTGWGESIDGDFDFRAGTMEPVAGTEWFALEARVGRDARIEYLLAYGQADYRRDPHNPRGRHGGAPLGGPPASEFVMPGYQPPPEFSGPPAAHAGMLAAHTLQSRALRRPCTLTVYTPPGYRPDQAYPLAVFSDLGPRDMPRVLDWAIAHGDVPPLVAVFALPDSLNRDMPSGAEMDAFLVDELPHWVSARYRLATDPRLRTLVAISFGARDALHAALTVPDAYGSLGLLIPGRRIADADVAAIASGRNRRLRVAIVAGRYDQANVPTAHALRRAFADSGCALDYLEVPEGHSPATFHYHLREVLARLFSRLPSS